MIVLNDCNWIERTLEHVAVCVDDFKPSGAEASFKLLEQVIRETSLRPADLAPEFRTVPYDPRLFRHAVQYGCENPMAAEETVE